MFEPDNNYKYILVEFIKKGKCTVKSIEAVPSKWVSYNEKKKRLVARFLKPKLFKGKKMLILKISLVF